jgi:hypothetical protein
MKTIKNDKELGEIVLIIGHYLLRLHNKEDRIIEYNRHQDKGKTDRIEIKCTKLRGGA